MDADNDAVNTELISEASRIINNSYYIQRLDSQNYSNNKEKIRVKYLIGLALFKSTNYKKAYDYFIDIYEREIFNLRADLFLDEFNNGIVSNRLHLEFKEKGFLIPAGALIYLYSVPDNILKKKNTWIIVDGESIYKICTTSNSIVVYYRELSLIIYFSKLLESLNQQNKALNILKEEVEFLNNRILFHHYANLLIRQECIGQAMSVYEKHLCHPPYDKQFFVEYALLLKHSNKKAEVKKTCAMVIDLGMAKDRRECYYHGFAYFLMDKLEQAHAYYIDSGPYGKHYSLVV